MQETKEEGTKSRVKLSKNVLNVIRTTMRNNIELTNIADNKANVLLSLNALMLTFLVPVIIAKFDFVIMRELGLSLAIFITTCLVTIYLAALALKPGDFRKLEKQRGAKRFASPFFFGNYHLMKAEDFEAKVNEALLNEDTVRKHIIQDLYYVGARLGQKMYIIRVAFNIFMAGIIISVLIAAATMLFVN